MEVIDLLTLKIRELGGDGLVNVDAECGCKLEDLAPCGSVRHDCQLASEERACKGSDFDFLMIPFTPSSPSAPRKDIHTNGST
jgi:hypothetical protein